MAAASTDKFLKVARAWVGQIGAGGVADDTTATIPLASVTNLPTDTAVVAVIDRVDADGDATASLEEVVIGVVSGSNLTTCTRGVEGTAQAHSAGAVVEILWTATNVNYLIDALLTGHDQTGRIKTHQWYAADAGANDTYAITLSPAPTAYTAGMVVNFKANTANTGAATLNVNALGAKTIKKLNDQDLATGDIEASQIVSVIYDGTNFQMQSQIAADASTVTTSSSDTFTNKTLNSNTNTIGPSNKISFNSPQGFLINGKLAVSVSSNNITVALKGLDGNDPSATNPVYCRIGDSIRSVTAALAVTKNAGTNWFNSGATELATLEIDYFAYLGYNATDGVVIGFARIPYAKQYGDFSTTSTNDRYCAISTITTAANTDYYEVIGRFAATLSATASFNWSVPTYTAVNLVQRPIFTTRWLACTATFTGFSANPTNGSFRYQIAENILSCKLANWTAGTSNATTFTIKAPFTMENTGTAVAGFAGQVTDSGTVQTTPGNIYILANTNTINLEKNFGGGGFTNSGSKNASFSNFSYPI